MAAKRRGLLLPEIAQYHRVMSRSLRVSAWIRYKARGREPRELARVRVGGKEAWDEIKNGLLSERTPRGLRRFFFPSLNQFPRQHFPGFGQVGRRTFLSAALCAFL